jgi:sodium-dependent dicarboxylate transporter 2/3/5
MPIRRVAGLAAGVVALLAFLLIDTPLQQPDGRAAAAAGVVALMAIWWLTEAVPIHWTAMVPLVAFPLFSVFGPGLGDNLLRSARPYVDPYIFLFAGGMAIAAAMQQWGLHRRIALAVMSAVGTKPPRLLLGFLCATAFVSLWISNTATAAMMLPIGLAVISQLEHGLGGRRLERYGMAIMLAIAYGANVGGIGTKIGTAPNAQFAGFMEGLGVEISFLQFLAVGLPFVLLFLPIAWWRLWTLGRADRLLAGFAAVGRKVISSERRALGAMAAAEKIVLAVFLITAALWIAGRPLTDWVRTHWPETTTAEVEGSIAVAAALLLALLRSRGHAVLEWRALVRQPWSTLLLLGGGFAMAAGVQASGLSGAMARALAELRDLPGFAQVLVATTVAVGISAIASNTSTIAILLVVLRDAVDPSLRDVVLFAATIACSCDFALPAGTPPNAIVFASGYVKIPLMARTGVVLDLMAALLVAAWCWVVVPLVL